MRPLVRLERVDPATGRLVASIRVGRTSYDVAYGAGAIWVTNRNGGTVQRISVKTNKVVKTIRFPGRVAPAGIAWSAGAIWVGDDYGRFLYRINPRTHRFTRVRSGGDGASWVAAKGTDVWVSNRYDGTVSRIDAQKRRLVSTTKVGAGPVNLDVIAGDVCVPNDEDDTLWRLDGATGAVKETIGTGPNPAVVAGAAGRRVGLDPRGRRGLAHPPGVRPRILSACACTWSATRTRLRASPTRSGR
jgi:DNA-binding beta-propeller fold protein YncE